MLFASEESQFLKLGLSLSVQRVTDVLRSSGRNVMLLGMFFLRALVKTCEQAVCEATHPFFCELVCDVCLPTAVLRTQCSYKCVTQLCLTTVKKMQQNASSELLQSCRD